jgi:4-carboxymuconolactone decarboxylase
MSNSELYEKGQAMRAELYGSEAAAGSARSVYDSPIMEKFLDVAIEHTFGGIWTRPGLDLKTRAMICVVSDAATGREQELAIHLRFARRQGWSEDELVEALIHMSSYVGLPLVRGALLVADRTFETLRAEEAGD